MGKPKGLFLLSPYAYDEIYGPEDRAEIERLTDMIAPPCTQEEIARYPELLESVEVIFSGWGVPVIDDQFLAHAPCLKAIFHGAGSVRKFITDAVWDRKVRVVSAAAANAVPVAEYVLSQILFSLKLGWQFVLSVREERAWPRVHDDGHYKRVFGAFNSTVGIISLGAISLKLIELLRPFDIHILVCSDHLTKDAADELGVTKCEMDELFEKSDVVSLHSPATAKNIGLITGQHFLRMKPYASFINSARGAVVKQQEMAEVLLKRKDLVAILDVTDPEPPEPGSILFSISNIVMTPHIAGSLGHECNRMGAYIVDELKRYLADEALLREITQDSAAYLA